MTNLEEFETYEEYLKNFRKTYSKYPNMQPMSIDQFELAKKNAEKQAKMKAAEEAEMKAAEEAGTNEWWLQEDGPTEEIIKKYGNTTSADIAEQASTPKQFGQANGNQGDDHVNNPEKLDTAEITKLQNEREKLSGQKNSYTPEETEAAKNSAGITKEVPGSTSANDTANNALTDSVSEVTTPKKDDSPGVVDDKNNYNKSMMSIWDAYRNGLISKETAGYFTIDAIATLARNLGRSIGNVGAQFSGGTIDNGHDESKWEQRQNALLNETIGKETESLGGAAGRKAESESLDNAAKRIRNAYKPKELEQQIEMFKRDLEIADINLDMAHSRTDLINFIKSDPDYSKSPFKMGLVAYLTQAGAAGAANNASKTLGDAINWMLTFIK